MGIDEDKYFSPNASLSDHQSLFTDIIPTIVFKDYYINANSGFDNSSCGDSISPCKIRIKSQGYIQNLNSYTKYHILTSSQDNSLFTISDIGNLELLGLHFDNLNPNSQNPLIAISSNNNNQIPKLYIADCELQQDSSSYQSTRSGSGAAINADLKQNSALYIQDQSSFTDCVSQSGNGGGIYSVISGGIIKLSGTTFERCLAENGGGIYIDIDFEFEFEFKINDALIQDCEAKADPTKSYPAGYIGGIFLIGTGDYDSSTKTLDFRWMNITGNTAGRGGQSLYIVMTKLAE
ncbi:MAG: hypothetical protein EZS28_043808, partial [Streblomastix strix]